MKSKYDKEIRDILWRFYRSKGNVEFLQVSKNDRFYNLYDYIFKLGGDMVGFWFEKFPNRSYSTNPKKIKILRIYFYPNGKSDGYCYHINDILDARHEANEFIEHPKHLKCFKNLIDNACKIRMDYMGNSCKHDDEKKTNT